MACNQQPMKENCALERPFDLLKKQFFFPAHCGKERKLRLRISWLMNDRGARRLEEELCDTLLPNLSRARNSVPELIICHPSGGAVKKVK
jgi:hypothetical protein